MAFEYGTIVYPKYTKGVPLLSALNATEPCSSNPNTLVDAAIVITSKCISVPTGKGTDTLHTVCLICEAGTYLVGWAAETTLVASPSEQLTVCLAI